MPLSFDLLRTFLAVYRSGSVTRAAELLTISQPSVTAQVKALEATLRRPLFDRLPRGMSPTPAAHQLARRIAAPLDNLEELVLGDLSGPAEAFGRAVHLGGPAELICERVLPSLATMAAGGLQLRVTLGLPDGLLAALADGGLDLVVSSVRTRRGGLRVEPLWDEEFVLVAARSWARRLGAGGADLGSGHPGQGREGEAEAVRRAVERAPLVAYAENLPILRRYWRTVFGVRLTRSPTVVVPDLRGVAAAVAGGAGVSVLPRYLCTRDLVTLHEPEIAPLNTLFLVSRAGAPHPAAAAVRDHLLEAARSWVV
ncbi:LysR family transcriptional regulator [Nonomuraea typhae]|uniref:LysR family transcriptional regulator n=1 Tax=Nonomuraea typhae TaxID=2603600 RepID=UPI0012F96793|nr:LysR family transcriptional regulator [Nonomuraea typhae]